MTAKLLLAKNLPFTLTNNVYRLSDVDRMYSGQTTLDTLQFRDNS